MREKIVSFGKTLKPFVKPWLVCFAIYCVAMLSIWRGGVSFIDDRLRAVVGYGWVQDFNRHASTLFGMLVNMNHLLSDISPWTQILAMGTMSVVSVMVTYVFCGRKIKYLPLVLSTFIGLQPFVIECWLYKFDAPCIALSILMSVLPIMWWPRDLSRKSLTKFGGVAAVCMLVMWMSYQASNGVFIVMCTMMGLKDYLDGVKIREIMRKWLVGLGACVVTAGLFMCLPGFGGYRDIEMSSFGEIIANAVKNIGGYAGFVWQGLNVWQKWFFMPLAIIGIVILLFLHYKKKAWAVMLVELAVLPMSLGVYLLLTEPVLNGRTLVGLGLAAVPVLILATNELGRVKEYALTMPSLILLYTCIIFTLALGNGLVEQEKYRDFRMESLMDDLAELYPGQGETAVGVLVTGEIGYTGVTQHVVEMYPVTESIVVYQQKGLSYGMYAVSDIGKRYNWSQEVWSVEDDDGAEYERRCSGTRTVVKETYYHTIRDDGEGIVCVEVRK